MLKLDAGSGAVLANVAVGPNPRHVSVTADGATVYVSDSLHPRCLARDSARADRQWRGGSDRACREHTCNAEAIRLAHSDRQDFESQGRGIPNYLGAAVISPDGTQAWVPSKQDNIARGAARDGLNINFQNTVRAISSRVDLLAGGQRRCGGAHRSRQLQRRERGRVRPAGRLHVRRARNEPRSRRGRRPWPVGDLPLRRRPGAAGSRTVRGRRAPVREQFHGPHGGRVRSLGAAHDWRYAGDLDR